MKQKSTDGAHHLDRIPELLGRPAKKRDIVWLEKALQSAVSVEFSTIPPYLCALWSIKNEMDPVAKSIRNVVHEEMLHMSLACNMLTAIGCVPQIDHPLMVPRYPGPIPGKVHPGLEVFLAGLSDASLDVFIAIEEPSAGDTPEEATDLGGFKTIGDFYGAIRQAFRTLKPTLSADRQVSGPLAYMVMHNLDAVDSAIKVILDQGEGSETSPKVDHTDELAHYYRFKEIRERRHYSHLDASGKACFEGPPLEFPEVWPVAKVPDSGYLRADVPAEVWDLIEACDKKYTEMLGRLQAVWETGGQAPLIGAIESMFGLSQLARRLMQQKIGDGPLLRRLMQQKIGDGPLHYGPCFRLFAAGAATAPRQHRGRPL